jgi:hypothetical protein
LAAVLFNGGGGDDVLSELCFILAGNATDQLCFFSSKGQWHEIFDLWFFSSNIPTWAPYSRVKAFLHMASN